MPTLIVYKLFLTTGGATAWNASTKVQRRKLFEQVFNQSPVALLPCNAAEEGWICQLHRAMVSNRRLHTASSPSNAGSASPKSPNLHRTKHTSCRELVYHLLYEDVGPPTPLTHCLRRHRSQQQYPRGRLSRSRSRARGRMQEFTTQQRSASDLASSKTLGKFIFNGVHMLALLGLHDDLDMSNCVPPKP